MTRAVDRVYEAVRDRIISGELAPGAPLREEQLAEMCGVSRTPVREALRRLEAAQFVVRTDSQRNFVAEWSGDDIEESFLLRGMLEGHAAARAARRIAPPQLAAMRTANDAIHRAIALPQPDIPVFIEQNQIFHHILLEAAASPRLAVALGPLIEQPVVRRTALRYDRHELGRSALDHGELLEALAAGDPAWAEAVMAAHLRRAFHAFSGKRPSLSVVSDQP